MDTKALRQKILDLAIRGKLVPQDPNDEPASVLLERIRAEKQQMVKDGKLKAKDIKNDTVIFKGDDNLHYEQFADGTVKCIEDEIPFDLPEGWEWCRLQTLCVKEIKRGKAPKYEEKSDTLVFAQKCNTKDGYIDISKAKFLDQSTLKKYTDEDYLSYNDIIINSTGTGTLGRIGIYMESDDAYGIKIVPDSHITIVRAMSSEMNSRYVYYFLKYHQSYFENSGVGSTNQKELKPEVISTFLVAVPPIEEQNNIVSKIDIANNYSFDLDNKKEQLKELISAIKSKILDLAIRGKLVPQDPNDEPASVLLERIRAEKEELIKQGKIKRDKKESVIFKGDDNSYYRLTSDNKRYDVSAPFDLPDCWEWTTFPTVAHVELGKTLDKVKNTGTYYPYLRSVNVQWGYVDLSDVKEMKFEPEEIERYTIKKNDLLICEGGDVGRCCVWNKNESILYQNAIHRVRFYNSINCNFYMYFMMYLEAKGTLKRISNGVTIKHLTNTVLSNIIIPLPPLAEQERIVNAVETLFAQIDKIAEQIS